MQLTSQRLGLPPSQISSWKVLYCCPRAGFCGRTKTQTLPRPLFGTFNDSKVSRQSASFLFSKYGHRGLLSVTERWSQSLQTSCCPRAAQWQIKGGLQEPAAKTRPPPPFGSSSFDSNHTSFNGYQPDCCKLTNVSSLSLTEILNY